MRNNPDSKYSRREKRFKNFGKKNSSNDVELAKLEWEKEQTRKAEKSEEKAKREAKAKALKEEGKPFMAFVTEKQETVGWVFLYALMIVGWIFMIFGQIAGIIASVVLGIILSVGCYFYFKEWFKK